MLQETELRLELGDIIRVNAPVNKQLHDKVFYISYIDETKHTTWVNTETMESFTVQMKNGRFDSSASIEKILLLSRSPEKGYAKQNGLVLGTWIDVHFGDDIPAIVTACITNLEEDMIEITTYVPEEEGDKLYIDFAYKGIPEEYPIKRICIREPPLALQKKDGLEQDDAPEPIEGDEPSMEFNDDGSLAIYLPPATAPDERYQDVLYELQSKEPSVEEQEDSPNAVYLPKHLQLYKLDAQVNQLYDDFLSRIPDKSRTTKVMNNIRTHVKRFQELRELFSQYDEFEQITGRRPAIDPRTFNPLSLALLEAKQRIPWVYPVVSQTNTVYDSIYDEQNKVIGIDPNETATTLKEENRVCNTLFYENTYGETEFVQYEHMRRTAMGYLNSFEPLFLESFPSISTKILSDADYIVANSEGVEAKTANIKGTGKNLEIDVKNNAFTVQRYNAPSHYSTFVSKNNFETRVLFPGDHSQIHSFLFMPENTMHHTRMFLPGSNVLNKANLHNYGKYPYKQFSLRPRMLITFEGDKENQLFPRENKIQMLTLSPVNDENINLSLTKENIDYDSESYKYMKANVVSRMNEVLPNIYSIIDKYEKYIPAYNVTEFLQYLEPFAIYEDNVTATGMKKIRYFINKFRNNYLNEFNLKRKKFQKLDFETFNEKKVKALPAFYSKTIALLLDEDHVLNSSVKSAYNSQNIDSSLLLKYMYVQDDGKLFTQVIRKLNSDLTNSEDFFKEIDIQPVYSNLEDNEEDNESLFLTPTDCYRKIIVKDYKNLREMELDNHKTDVEYDTKYDNTNYGILDKYKREKESLSKTEFLAFLSEELVKKHSCPSRMSKEFAETLVKGKRYIQDGEYAKLIITPSLPNDVDETELTPREKEEIEIEKNARKKESYYVRKRNIWIHDKTVDENSFLDTNTLFCNIQNDNKCYKKDEQSNCETIELDVKERMLREEKRRMNEELHSRYESNLSNIKEDISKTITMLQDQLTKSTYINSLRSLTFNNRANHIGNNVYRNERLRSPHWIHRNHLFHQSLDFSNRQTAIIEFYRLYCREPLSNEKPGWKYCFETDTELLECSLYELAVAFHEGEYLKKLDILIKKQGTLSDDGGHVIDKYTGCILKQIEYSEDGSFLHTFAETDEQDTSETSNDDENAVFTKVTKVKSKRNTSMYDDEMTQHMFEWINGISEKTFIEVETIEQIAINICVQLSKEKKVFPSEKLYTKLQEKTKEKDKAKGKKAVSYDVYINSKKAEVAGAAFIVAIQSLMPSLQITKYEKSCKKSFTGYPLETTGTRGAITYIACVMRFMSKDAKIISPKAGVMEDKLYSILEKYIVPLETVQTLLNTKRDYVKEHESETIPDDLNVSLRWHRFSPPTYTVKIMNESSKPLRGVATEYHKNLEKMFQDGSKDQWASLSVYTNKIEMFAYGIVQLLAEILGNKDTLLNTFSQIPFQQNACCNESNERMTVLQYFIKEDDRLEAFLKNTQVISRLLKGFKLDMKTPFLHERVRDVQDVEKLSATTNYYKTIEKELMYKIFFHYCKYDLETYVMPSDLKEICGERPPEYDPKASLEQKMEMMAELGKTVSTNKFMHMMTAINKRNAVNVLPNIEYNWKSQIITELEQFRENIRGEEDVNTITSFYRTIDNFTQLMTKFLQDETQPENALEENTSQTDNVSQMSMRQMNNFLYTNINAWKRELEQFLRKNVKKQTKTQVTNMINEFFKILFENEQYEISFVTNTVQRIVTHISTLFPLYVGTEYKKKILDYSEQWGFTEEDTVRFKMYTTDTFEQLNTIKGEKYNANLTSVMTDIVEKLQPVQYIMQYLSQILEHSPENRSVILRMHMFIVLLVLHTYINSSESTEIIQRTNRIVKQSEDNNDTDDVEYDMMEDKFEEQSGLVANEVKQTLQESLGELLAVYLQFSTGKRKHVLFKSYQDIVSIVDRSSEIEKNKVKKYFSDLRKKGKDVLRAEVLMKRMRLGKYFVNQKDLVTYGKKVENFFGEDEITDKDQETLLNDLVEEEMEDNGMVGYGEQNEENLFDMQQGLDPDAEEDELLFADEGPPEEDDDLADIYQHGG